MTGQFARPGGQCPARAQKAGGCVRGPAGLSPGAARRGDVSAHLAKAVCVFPVLGRHLLNGRMRDVEGPRPPDTTNPRTPKTHCPGAHTGVRTRQAGCSLAPSGVLSPGTSRMPPGPPPDSPHSCDAPWSPATYGRRGLWWTRPGCACTLWGQRWGQGSRPGHGRGPTSGSPQPPAVPRADQRAGGPLCFYQPKEMTE